MDSSQLILVADANGYVASHLIPRLLQTEHRVRVLVRLYVEIKLPGQGWLQFAAEPVDEEHARLVQTAFYAPKGLLVLLYWQVLQPIHTLIFHRMIKTLAVKARAR